LRVWAYNNAGVINPNPGAAIFVVVGTTPSSVFPLTDGTGTTAVDLQGSDVLTLHGYPSGVNWQNGADGISLAFSGTTGSADSSVNDLADGSGNFSVEAFAAPGGEGDGLQVVASEALGASGYVYVMGIDHNDCTGSDQQSCYVFGVENPNHPATTVWARSDVPVEQDVVLLVGEYAFNGDDDPSIQLWVRTQDEGTVVTDPTPLGFSLDGISPGTFTVGQISGTTASPWNGEISTVKIWPGDLTEDQVDNESQL
jgi:hypothetical protein